jgi:NADH dehydrogenase
MMSPQASQSAERFLREHDVNIWLGVKVQSYDGKAIVLSNGRTIQSHNVIWAAGVTGAIVPGLKPEIVAGGRIKTDSYNRVEGYQNIFSIGDVAAVLTDKAPRGYPMLAPVAIQQAKLLARNIAKLLRKETRLKAFQYRNLGVLATVGRHEAVADLFFGKFQGPIAWFMWAFLHLVTLVGFRNRLVALVTWSWSYFRYDQGLRLIIRPQKYEH